MPRIFSDFNRARKRQHYRENTAKYRFWENPKIKRATPPWLTEEHWSSMNKMYEKARALGQTVDHIEPIDGLDRCGLHVPWNLQIIPLVDNIMKGIYVVSGD
jgi:hypothetical protein